MGKKVQFILRSADIYTINPVYTANAPPEDTSDYVNPNTGSTINQWHTNMSWKNVNLKLAMGAIYKQGKNYKLRLENIAFCITSNQSNYTTVENDRSFNIYMRMNPNPFMLSYSTKTQSQNEVLLSSLRLPNGAQSYIYNFSNREFHFESSQIDKIQTVDVDIAYRDLLTNINEPSANLVVGLPHVQFTFSIEEDD